MKLKAIFFAACIALSCVPAAYAAFPTDAKEVTSVDEDNFDNIYSAWLTDWTKIFNATVGQGNWSVRTVGLDSEKYLMDIPDLTALKTNNAPGIPAFTALFYYPGVTATYTAVPTVAVPGPEAGVGVGALLLGGMAFWVVARRRDASMAV